MAFFSTENPVLLLVALVLLIAVLRGYLGTKGIFIKHSYMIVPVIFLIALFAVINTDILAIIGNSAGMLVALLIFIIFIVLVLAAMGTKESLALSVVKQVGFLKLTVIIVVAGIFILSISQVYGNKLLNEPKVSFSEGFVQESQTKDLDLSPLFSPSFLGIFMVLLVLGMFFLWVLIR